MFTKLLKHEWKAGRRTLGILTLAVLGIGLAATGVLRILAFLFDRSMVANPVSPFVFVALSVSLVFMGIGLAVYATATQILLLYRFYRHKFTDEGYLTFTLPATPSQLFLSSYVNILIWTLISGAAIALSVFLAALFGPAKDSLLNLDVLSVLGEALKELSDEPLWGLSALPVVSSLFCNPLISMSCITIGAVLAKKHKLLAAFGIYYAFSALSGFVGTVLMFMASLVSYRSGELFLILSSVLPSLLQIGAAVGGSFLSVHLMKNKLNLP